MSRAYYKCLSILAIASCGGGGGSPQVDPPPLVSCSVTARWTLPTRDIDNDPLPFNSLTEATLYITRIPMVTYSATQKIKGISPYILAWEIQGQLGTYYMRMTVSNAGGESDLSNEVAEECL